MALKFLLVTLSITLIDGYPYRINRRSPGGAISPGGLDDYSSSSSFLISPSREITEHEQHYKENGFGARSFNGQQYNQESNGGLGYSNGNGYQNNQVSNNGFGSTNFNGYQKSRESNNGYRNGNGNGNLEIKQSTEINSNGAFSAFGSTNSNGYSSHGSSNGLGGTNSNGYQYNRGSNGGLGPTSANEYQDNHGSNGGIGSSNFNGYQTNQISNNGFGSVSSNGYPKNQGSNNGFGVKTNRVQNNNGNGNLEIVKSTEYTSHRSSNGIGNTNTIGYINRGSSNGLGNTNSVGYQYNVGSNIGFGASSSNGYRNNQGPNGGFGTLNHGTQNNGIMQETNGYKFKRGSRSPLPLNSYGVNDFGDFNSFLSSNVLESTGIQLRTNSISQDGYSNGPQQIIHKNIYVHVPPPELEEPDYPAQAPLPIAPSEKNYKIIFIKAPALRTPPQAVLPLQPVKEEKTLVYVLVKKPENLTPPIISTPEPTKPSKPEVFFIRYKTVKEGGGYPETSSNPGQIYGIPGYGNGAQGLGRNIPVSSSNSYLPIK